MEIIKAVNIELETSNFVPPKCMASGIVYCEKNDIIYIGGGGICDRECSDLIFRIDISSGAVEKIGKYPYGFINGKMHLKEINGRNCLFIFGGVSISKNTESSVLEFHILDLEGKNDVQSISVRNFANRFESSMDRLNQLKFIEGLELFYTEEDGKEYFSIICLHGHSDDWNQWKNIIVKFDVVKEEIIEVSENFEYEKGLCFSVGCIIDGDYYTWYGDKEKSYLVKLDIHNPRRKWELVSEKNIKHLGMSRSLSYDERYFIFLPCVEAGETGETLNDFNPFGNINQSMIYVLNLSTKKWRDVKIEADFRLVRIWPSCCMIRGNLYIYGGSIMEYNDSVYSEDFWNDLFVINLFGYEEQDMLDMNCRIDFLMNMEEDIRGTAHFFVVKMKILEFSFPKILIWDCYQI